MRVLLTGSTGRLGGAFLSLWGRKNSDYTVEILTRAEADLTQPERLIEVLWEIWRERPFDILVNPAAMSGLEQCLDFPNEAQRINAISPRVMAEFCNEVGVRMVHFSTDYVFAGLSPNRPCEGCETGAVNLYGMTKRAGEEAVLETLENALVCRVSWLFGPEGKKSHFDHVLDKSDIECAYIADKYSMPTFTHDIVEWVDILLKNNSSGIYHLCNSGEPESWFSYAEKVLQLAAQKDYPSRVQNLKRASLAHVDFFREKRPQHTAMLPQRLVDEGLIKPRNWLEAAEVYLKIR